MPKQAANAPRRRARMLPRSASAAEQRSGGTLRVPVSDKLVRMTEFGVRHVSERSKHFYRLSDGVRYGLAADGDRHDRLHPPRLWLSVSGSHF